MSRPAAWLARSGRLPMPPCGSLTGTCSVYPPGVVCAGVVVGFWKV